MSTGCGSTAPPAPRDAGASSTVQQEEFTLDRAAFTRTLRVVALRLPTKLCNAAVKQLQNHVLRLRHVKAILKSDDGNDERRVVLLATEVEEGKTGDDITLADLPAPVKAFVEAAKEEQASDPIISSSPSSPISLTIHQVIMDYNCFTVEEVLKQFFAPLQMEAPTSFETIDHVAHINLRDAYLPYKRLIAQVILDKNSPRIRTVVNKTGNIETRFRTFPLEVLAGENNLEVSVRESGATFHFNYAEVYWNSRLSTEHGRLIHSITKQFQARHPRSPLAACVVWDVFAGVGPFAVPLGVKGCVVHANDLNPRSHHYLLANINKNKVDCHVTPYNEDGRVFLRERARRRLPVHHVIMNLPASALEFLDEFSAQREREEEGKEGQEEEEEEAEGLFDYLEERPYVHVHCFSKADDPTTEALAHASDALGCELLNGKNGVSVHRVRDVAPKKEMLCISFPLPRYSELRRGGGGGKRGTKRTLDEEGKGDSKAVVQSNAKEE
ncbi:trna (guanine-n)-methyltransferase-like protein [Nannochloropsis oceanica]